MKKALCAASVSCFAAVFAFGAFPLSAQAECRQILVTDTAELLDALGNAQAGDEIILREGLYQNDKWTGKWAAFWSEASGTENAHIVLRSEDAAHPATISGVTQEKKYALNIIGSYWELRDLKICNAAKGIFLAQSEHSLIDGCEVYEIGSEGIHIIDDSSFNTVQNCWIHDTGTVEARYGEGVYIGSAKNATDYGFECHQNTVRCCRFGPNIAADHVDIKEYTVGNVVEYCTFDGTGIQGENGGDSFVEAKGNDAVIRYNTGYRNGAEKQLYAFDMNVQLDGWGQNTKIYGNTLYLDSPDIYVVKGWNCTAQIFGNTVEPAECVSNGNKIMQIRRIALAGDVTGDGAVNTEDVRLLRDELLGKELPYSDAENADLNGDRKLNAIDLTLLKQMLLQKTVSAPSYDLCFTKEDAGKWRLTDGLGGRTLTFTLRAEPGSTLNLGWGYWNPAAENESTGGTGKWTTVALKEHKADADGRVQISTAVPEDCTRVAFEIWDYNGRSGAEDKNSAELESVTTA